MGDPRRFKKKYATPRHPWKAENIALEKELIKEYGLKNKKEIWKMHSVLKKYKDIAKRVIAVKTKQEIKEKKQMMEKLYRLGLINQEAELDDVLGLEIKDVMERRLQSLVFRRGLARSMRQARQFIVHRHIKIGNKKITFPSYLVLRGEEELITFDKNSPLSREDHPERIVKVTETKEEEEIIKKERKKKETTKKAGEEELFVETEKADKNKIKAV